MKTVRRGVRGAMIAVMCAAGCSDDGSVGSGTQSASTSAPSSASGSTASPTTGGASANTSDSSESNSGSSSGVDPSAGPTSTASPGTSTGPDPTTGPGTTGPGTTGTTGPGTTTGGEEHVVRFVVLGDTGEGNEDQYMVADAIVAVCEQRGCDWAMLTGDNFYDSGVSGVDDPQWQEKFELPYQDFTFPVYAVLGNHDYGGGGIGVDFFDPDKDEYQVEYTKYSNLWRMPAKYYSWKQAHAEFWALDTNQVMTDPFNGDSEPQLNWLKQTVAASAATWKIAFGHHPYLSNGEHGNAGNYENLEGIPLPFVAGEQVKEFMEAGICNKVDVYICGHDHTIQWLHGTCGTEFIVSGAGSKANSLPGNNPAHFQAAETEGFLWVELKDNSFTGIFYDKTGKELYSRTFTK